VRERNSARSHDFGSIEENHFVHNAGLQGGAIEFGSCFEEKIKDLALAELAENGMEIDMAALCGQLDDFCASADQGASFRRVERLGGEDYEIVLRRLHEF